MKRLLLALAVLLTAFVAISVWALEWDGVATIETSTGAGAERTTRVWYVAAGDGAIHVEAGGAASPWLADVRENPVVLFDSADMSGRYRAAVLDNPEGHERIRSELRGKYGLRDVWVGVLVDTSSSSMVVLEPAG